MIEGSLIVDMSIEHGLNVVAARQAAREIALGLGVGAHDSIRVATAASEAARYVLKYCEPGRLRFCVARSRAGSPALCIEMICRRLDGRLLGSDTASVSMVAPTLDASMRLMDEHTVGERDGCTTVALIKLLPGDTLPAGDVLRALAARVTQDQDVSGYQELQRQNRELLATLVTLRERQEELTRLTHELEDTNRGVLALYAEIDNHARQLKRADEMKSRFLSSVSHELRTPLASVQALSKLLLARTDGDLTAEQATQVQLIDAATRDLIGLVDDLLDLAKIEAGKVVLRPEPFLVTDLFSALRGMFKPLSMHADTVLVFGEPPVGLSIVSDEAKVAQILRNFLSNALKFTPRGEVRLDCCEAGNDAVALRVTDTGIGIAAEDLERVFEEFSQVEHPLQRDVKGTGLGLPLCARLAGLLGGRIEVDSQPGTGSVFALVLPRCSGPLAPAQIPIQPAHAFTSVAKRSPS